MTPSTLQRGVTPLILDPGLRATVTADAFAGGQISVPGTTDVRVIAPGGTYVFGPYSVSRHVVVSLTGGSATATVGDTPSIAETATAANSGLRILIIDASTGARANPQWNVAVGNYSRTNGIATVTYDYTLADQYFLPGHRISFRADKRPDLEVAYAEVLTSSTNAGVSGTVTFRDPRPDVASNSIAANVELYLHDMNCWTITAGFPVWANMALGGRADIRMIATGSTNIDQWDDERLAQAANLGQFDIVVIGCGLWGNAINGAGLKPSYVYSAGKRLINAIRDRLRPRAILIENIPPTRQTLLVPTNSVVTSAYRMMRKINQDLQNEFRDVRVIPCAELLVENYCAFNASPSTDMANGWGALNNFVQDGVHPAFGWTMPRGLALGDTARDIIAPFASPEMGSYVDTKAINNVVDADGYYNPNRAAGLWGNIDATKVTYANTGCSGNGVAGSAVSFTAGRGTSTCVGSLATDPTGGANDVMTVTGNGSASGYTLVRTWTPTTLLAELQAAAGKEVDILMPLTVQLNAGKIVYVELRLDVTVSGQSYTIASPQRHAGQYTMGSQTRAMDSGYSGVIRWPRFKVPPAVASASAATYTLTVKEANASVVSGTFKFIIGSGYKLEVIEG